MNEIRVRQLGLAAYIKMVGADLLRVEEKDFIFRTDKSLNDWRVEYHNSCCMRHDSLVCELRYFLKEPSTS